MRKISNRDINFLLNVVIISLIFMAVLHSIQPLVTPPDQRLPQVGPFTKELLPLSPAEVFTKTQMKDKPSVVMVYASWCGYCRKLLPEMVELMHEKKLDGVNLTILSIDQEPADLSKYLVLNDYKGVFPPYILNGGSSAELRGALSITGSKFVGYIPYIGFFNKDGKLVAETFGMVDKGRLLAEIQKIDPSIAK